MTETEPDRARQAFALAVVFGAVSVPWTYGFEVTAGLPLWPSFIASATYFSTRGGLGGLGRGLAGNVVGGIYALGTLALEAALGLGPLGLAVAVGAGMFVAGLHAFVDALSFTPAGFFGYATLFSVEAAEVTLVWPGLAGIGVATGASLAIGAVIGWGADLVADRLAGVGG